LVPLKGSSVSLSLGAQERDEKASLSFSYVNETVNGLISFSLPLSRKVFNLQVEGDEASTPLNKTINAEALVRASPTRDYYFGFSGSYKLPNDGELPKYNVRGLLANKNSSFEGGLYINKSSDKENSTLIGSFASAETSNVTVSSNFSYDLEKREFQLDNFVLFPGSSDSNYLLGLQVNKKKSSFSFGVEKNLDKNTKLSFAYAYLLNQEIKSSAIRVGVELIL